MGRVYTTALAGALLITLLILLGPPALPASEAGVGIQEVGLPVRLTIPSLGVDASIEEVGLTPDGLMDAPKKPNNAGWYRLGPRPGEVGNAVIDGHSGWKEDTPAVFDSLYLLQKGDAISTTDARGVVTTFIVREKKIYDPEADAAAVFNASDGKAHLNLITCEGVWDAVTESYAKRLVIFADMQE